MMALFLGAFASNKVEGLALTKALLLGAEAKVSFWIFIVTGVALHLLIIGLLVRRFENLYI
jgi:hypothetical protein